MKYRVLLVEDEIKTGEMLKKALELQEITVDWVVDGTEAITVFNNNMYDLVVLDLKLPGLTGDQVLEEIRKKDQYTEVMVYTNYQDPPVMKKLINLGVDAYINKGADADLWDTVEQIKEKLEPFSKEKVEQILYALPTQIIKEDKE
ncbi:response regulator [Paenibacillus sp. FSL R7-0273]|uniref:response regulator n=1 Tax=Paenibacillus sp. FSL R7-0273 TaxID=1536772 RepID=UPI0006935152|nr:response regulator [Paenibacillus sp. FSL R7-0273]OMF90910.1 hypothetical protein BK144_16720 [Paenibacillus sp. FSL R7-0273]